MECVQGQGIAAAAIVARNLMRAGTLRGRFQVGLKVRSEITLRCSRFTPRDGRAPQWSGAA